MDRAESTRGMLSLDVLPANPLVGGLWAVRAFLLGSPLFMLGLAHFEKVNPVKPLFSCGKACFLTVGRLG